MIKDDGRRTTDEETAIEVGSGQAAEEKPKRPAAKKKRPAARKAAATPSPLPPLLTAPVQMYRVTTPLAKGQKVIPVGTLTRLEWLDAAGIARLERVGAVRAVMSPPLAELNGWSRRAERLAALGVVTMADFLAVSPAAIAEAMEIKTETAETWRAQLAAWSEAPEPPGRR